LFHDTSRYLADQKAYFEQTRIERESLQRAVARNLSLDHSGEIESHFEFMPDHYFRASDLEDIIDHLKLFRSFLGNVSSPPQDGFAAANRGEFPLAPAIRWKVVREQGHSVVVVWTWQRERLLAKIAGSFSVVPLNILSADVFPRGDNVVLCVFRVCDTKARPVTNPRDFELVEQTLRHALEDESFDFLPLIEKAKRQTPRLAPAIEFPMRIVIDSETHPTYTLIEIQAPDRIGLLYDVLSCLDRENVLIPLSRINTQAGAAIDALYVVDGSNHAKIIDAHRIRTIQQHLQNAILGGSSARSQ
jgi:[protein-PII] uridylyltransferase